MTQTDSHIELVKDPRLLAAVSAVLSAPEGRYMFRVLLSAYGIRQCSFDPDPHIHAFRSGMQNAGLLLEDVLVSASPGGYLQMLQEKET